MKNLRVWLMALLMILPIAASAQSLFDYQLQTGVDATKWMTLTSSAHRVWFGAEPDELDDYVSSLYNMGFTFNFCGTNYTQFSINTNGRVRLGSQLVSNRWNVPFVSATNAYQDFPLFSAYGVDSQYDTVNGGGHYIKYEVQGTAPNRVLLIEFKQQPSLDDNLTQWVNYQIQFHENGNVRYVYGATSDSVEGASYQIGIAVSNTLVIRVHNNALEQGYASVYESEFPTQYRYYEFNVRQTTCATPTNLAVQSSDTNYFTLQWQGSASNYKVAISRSEATLLTNPDTIIYTSSPTATYNSNSLIPGSNYYALVLAICSNDSSLAAITSLRVPCPALHTFELPYTENFDSYASGNTATIDPCWTKFITGSSDIYPYPSGTYYRSGARSLYFYYTSSIKSYAVLPATDVPVNQLALSFYTQRSNTSANYGRMEVGVMTDPSDPSTFQLIASTSCKRAYEWFRQEVSFASYTGSGRYIALRGSFTTTGYTYVDDIQLNRVAPCSAPYQAHVETLVDDSALIVWRDTSLYTTTPSYYEIQIATANGSFDTATPQIVYDTEYLFTGLARSTTYKVRIYSDCGQNRSGYELSFTTSSGAPMTIPYTQNFDGVTGGTGTTTAYSVRNLAGWYGGYSVLTTYYPSIYSTTRVSTPNSLRFYADSNSNYYSWATLPAARTNIGNLQLDFKMYRYGTSSYASYLIVGATADPRSIENFDTIATVDITNSPTGTWQDVSVPMDNYHGNKRHIVLIGANPNTIHRRYNTTYIDNLTVSDLPDCTVVNGISDTGRHFNSTTILWNDSQRPEYLVAYSKQSGFNPDTSTNILVTYDPYITLQNLDNMSTYYVRIKAVCTLNVDSAAWSSEYHFTTPLDCGTRNLVEPAIGSGTTAYGYAFYATTSTNAAYPFGMSYAIFSNSELRREGVRSDNLIRSMSLNMSQTANRTINNVKIYMAERADSLIRATSDSIPLNQMTLVYSANSVTLTPGWNEFMFTTPFHYTGQGSLVIATVRQGTASGATTFYTTSQSPNYRYLYVYRTSATASRTSTRTYYRYNARFKVCTTQPQCPEPTGIAVPPTSITATSADVTWPTTDYSQIEIVTLPVGGDPDTAMYSNISTSTSPVTLTGLTPNTVYNVYTRVTCPNGNYSPWSLPVQFTTSCLPETIPFREGFNSYTGSTSVASAQRLDLCWRQGTNYSSPYPYIYSGYSSHNGNCMRFYGTSTYYSYLTLPALNTPINQLQISFDYYKTSASYGRIEIGVMSDPNNISTFVPLDTILATDIATSTWTRLNFELENYTGAGKYITFFMRQGATNYVYIDEIAIDSLPTCRRPRNLALVSTTTNSATFNWQSVASNAQSYQIACVPNGTNLGASNGVRDFATTTTGTVTGLTPATYYNAYVRAICAPGDTSAWSDPILFSSGCTEISQIPYVENFDSYAYGRNALVPVCWTRYNNATSESYNTYPYISNGDALTGRQSLYLYAPTGASYATRQYMAMPKINTSALSLDTIAITFFARAASSAMNAKVLIGSLPNATTPANMTIFDTITLTDMWDEYTILPTGNNPYIFFLMDKGTVVQDAYIDSLRLVRRPSCSAPEITVSNVTSTSATISWPATNQTCLLEISQDSTDATGTNHTVVRSFHSYNTNSVMLQGLEPANIYRAKLKVVCPSGDTSMWSQSKIFSTTLCDNSNTATVVGTGAPYIMDENFIYPYYEYSYSQLIIDSAELAQLGSNQIDGFSYIAASNIGGNYNTNSHIYIGHTTKVEFDDVDDWVPLNAAAFANNFVEVFNGDIQYISGTNYIAFDSAFTWDGHRNIIIAVSRNHGDYVSCDGLQAVPSNRLRFLLYYQDGDSISISDPYDSNEEYDYIPYITLISCGMQCSAPIIASVDSNFNSVTVHWTGSANQYDVAIRPANSTQWSDSTRVATTQHTFNNLSQLSNYEIGLRAVCDTNLTSTWAILAYTTTELPCVAPDNLSATATFDAAEFTWNANGNEQQWRLHVWNSVFDSTYAVSSTTTTIGSLVQGRSYFAAVAAACAEGINSTFSDTIEFATDTCARVSNVTANPSSFSAEITWSAGSNNIASYEITYGLHGFVDGEGTTITSTEPQVTLTGLEPETTYDVTVRGYCSSTIAGQWTEIVSFRTETEGINSTSASTSLDIYPNPANGSTTLHIEGMNGLVEIIVVDLNGRTLINTTAQCADDCTANVVLTTLPDGIYMVQVKGAGNTAVRKLVVKH